MHWYFCVTSGHLSWACLFIFDNKKKTTIVFGNSKGSLTPKVKRLNQKEVPLHLAPNFAQNSTGEVLVNKWENIWE